MAGESGKKKADNFDTSVKKLEAVITRLREAISNQKTALNDRAKGEATLGAENKVLLEGLNGLKSDYETLSEAFVKIKEVMDAEGSETDAGSKEVKKLKEVIENQTFEYETLKASIDFIKEEHKVLIKRNEATEKKVAESKVGGNTDEGMAAELKKALADNNALQKKFDALKKERDGQDHHMESFARQHALGKNIKTILNKRIDATIIQLEDMLERQGG